MDDLVAAVIHDVKNALQSIDTRLAEAQHQPVDLAGARSDIARIAGQLAELLTIYRTQTGQLRLTIDDHDLADFVDDMAIELGAPPAGIALDIDRGAIAALGAWAFDAFLVKLALLDALRNAMRHARSTVGLTVSIAAMDGLCFSVSDDGPGFPEAVLIGGPVASGSGGTGLGLSFARMIAERHATPAGRHGRLELVNIPGASFRIHLP